MFARMTFKLIPRTAFLQRCFHKAQILSTIEVRMPSLSPTMTQGNIVKWHKKEGDQIFPGDMLCEIQTDKAVMAFEIEEEGTLAKILKGDNANEVAVGALIALIAEEGTDWKNVKIPDDDVKEGPVKTQASGAPAEVQRVERSHALGPAAKILLHQYNIEANKVEATGPRGILLKSDVLQYIKEKGLKVPQVEQTPAKPPSDAPKIAPSKALPVDVSFIQMPVNHSRINYKKLPIPHAYSSIDVCMDSVDRCCEGFKKDGLNVEYLDILIKAAAISLKRFPHLNAMWNNDDIQMLNNANVSFSSYVDESHIFQEIEDADSLTVAQISSKIEEFKKKAISKELLDLGVSKSSLLISYLGNVDITSHHSVVVPPFVNCLSFMAPRFILSEDCTKMLRTTISMSFDSRVMNDVDATHFLEDIKQMLENPSLMIAQPTNIIDIQKLFAK